MNTGPDVPDSFELDPGIRPPTGEVQSRVQAGEHSTASVVVEDSDMVTVTSDELTLKPRPPYGRKVGLPFGKNKNTCPVRALRAWLKASRVKHGPVFRRVNRSGHPSRRRGLNKDSIGKMLKRAARRARMKTGPLGGHSLRAGCITQAAMKGVREVVIQRQTGHKTMSMLRRYIRSSEILRENAAAGLGI